jgi:hypothetical protein
MSNTEKRWWLRVHSTDRGEPAGSIGFFRDDLDERSPSDCYMWFYSEKEAQDYWNEMQPEAAPECQHTLKLHDQIRNVLVCFYCKQDFEI